MELLSNLGIDFSIEKTAAGYGVVSKTEMVKYKSVELCDALWALVKKHLQEGRRNVG